MRRIMRLTSREPCVCRYAALEQVMDSRFFGHLPGALIDLNSSMSASP
jgi:hypothetical protein